MEKWVKVIRAAKINPHNLPSNLRYRRGPQAPLLVVHRLVASGPFRQATLRTRAERAEVSVTDNITEVRLPISLPNQARRDRGSSGHGRRLVDLALLTPSCHRWPIFCCDAQFSSGTMWYGMVVVPTVESP
jgi:hypothetical protein